MWLRREGDDLILRVRIQPRAAKNEAVGLHGDRLKIRLTAPPVEGAANAALIDFLADAFGTARSRIAIEAGQSSREKTVRVRAATCWPSWWVEVGGFVSDPATDAPK